MDSNVVSHVEGQGHGAFVIEGDGKRLAAMTYRMADNGSVVIEHTEVDASLRGTGAGGKLLESLIGWVRSTGKTVVPVCPYAKATIDKTPAYQDVLATPHGH